MVFTTLDILQLKKLMIVNKSVNKYLIFDSTDENKELLKKYNDVWSRIKNKIEAVSSGECEYEKIRRKLNLILIMTCH